MSWQWAFCLQCPFYVCAGGEGGECILVKQHRIDPDCTSDSVSAADNLAHPDNIGTSDPTPAPREKCSDIRQYFYRNGRGIVMSSFHLKDMLSRYLIYRTLEGMATYPSNVEENMLCKTY